jgi:hypothetical protein
VTIKYRCYLLDHDRIAAVQILECENDSAALIEAARMLIASPCTSAELWERDRKVSIVTRQTSAV